MNPSYRSIFVSRVAAALAGAEAVANLSHPGVKGAIREVLLRDLFRPLLPMDLGVGTGQIATSTGELSPQQDVVIFDRRILPPVVFESVLGIFPIESVLATVEVKTRLTATELTSAHRSALAVRQYSYLSGADDAMGRPMVHPIKKTIPSIFALTSDLNEGGKTELQRYQETDSTSDPVLRAICVSGCGYWYFSNGWSHVKPDREHSEVLSFIVGLYDMFAQVAESRCSPRLAGYIVRTSV